MTIRVGYGANTEIRINAVDDLDDSTVLRIVGTKPSGEAISWTAARYGTTNYITYTTSASDLDEVGTYVIRAYIEWGSATPRYGEITDIVVYALNERVTIDEVISYVNALTFLSCQTESESIAGTNTDADLLFMSQSFNQGNYYIFYGMAVEQLARDITKYGISLSDIQELSALAYLIQHYWESKFKDWDAKEVSINNDTVKKSVSGTSGYASYKSIISDARKSVSGAINTDIVKHADDEYFPDDFKVLPISDVEMDVV